VGGAAVKCDPSLPAEVRDLGATPSNDVSSWQGMCHPEGRPAIKCTKCAAPCKDRAKELALHGTTRGDSRASPLRGQGAYVVSK